MSKSNFRLTLFLAAIALVLTLTGCNLATVSPAPAETTAAAEPGENTQAESESTPAPEPTVTPTLEPTPTPVPEPVVRTIRLSFAGDCTIGTDPRFGYSGSFTHVFDQVNGDMGYFFRNVRHIFAEDDLTIVNLEGTFTTATEAMDKRFTFKGDPSYVNILVEGAVDIVNLANNHTYDYYEQGLLDTKNTLTAAGIDYYGDETILVREIDGIRIGFAGYNALPSPEATMRDLEIAMAKMEAEAIDLRIVTFHWGIERDNYYNETQTRLAEAAIDWGAHLVIGHHPHVLQGIEVYKDAYIVYSLANFVFGGNRNPFDKDSMITQHHFTFVDGELTGQELTIIPVSVSSRQDLNDYQPYVLEGDEARRVISRVNQYSQDFSYPLD